jgi:hypothetical protein
LRALDRVPWTAVERDLLLNPKDIDVEWCAQRSWTVRQWLEAARASPLWATVFLVFWPPVDLESYDLSPPTTSAPPPPPIPKAHTDITPDFVRWAPKAIEHFLGFTVGARPTRVVELHEMHAVAVAILCTRCVPPSIRACVCVCLSRP